MVVKSSEDQVREALHTHEVVLLAAAALAELRQSDTQSHLQRVQGYVRALGLQLGRHPAYAAVLTVPYVDALCACVPMYDIGTLAIADRILLKPGPLSAEETAVMRTHTTLGYDAIVRAEQTLGKSSDFLAMAKEVTLSHQEKWNGTGYPHGLAQTQIPLSARIIAVADVYDALISNKVYKQGVSHEAAVGVVFGERGSHFDPDVVDAFMDVSDQFEAIAQQFADSEVDMQRKIDYLAAAIAEVTEI